MKILSLLALSLVCVLAPLQAGAKDKGRAKITKNEAEHIALKAHAGARVTSATLRKMQEKFVWSIEIVEANGKPGAHVSVDAMSGQILAEKSPAR